MLVKHITVEASAGTLWDKDKCEGQPNVCTPPEYVHQIRSGNCGKVEKQMQVHVRVSLHSLGTAFE